jgi:hypothetical protein
MQAEIDDSIIVEPNIVDIPKSDYRQQSIDFDDN